MILRVLSRCFLNSGELSTVTTSLGSLFQELNALTYEPFPHIQPEPPPNLKLHAIPFGPKAAAEHCRAEQSLPLTG